MSGPGGMLRSMNRQEFWTLVEEARTRAAGDDTVAARAAAIMATWPRERIVEAAQPLWDLMADSYRGDLWGAAYLINGGASDDGFDYFRGWLISQGREVFEHAVADPDSLAGLPAVQAAAAEMEELENEDVLAITWNAHIEATGEELPGGAFTIRYPKIVFGWDFDDNDATRANLPCLAGLYLDPVTAR